MADLRLTEINIYPIKSARGISLQSARLDDAGVAYDRRWMLVDEAGHFLTQRTLPLMALIHVALSDDHLSVTSRGRDELCVPFRLSSPSTLPVQIWNDSLTALDTGPDTAAWFGEVMGFPCRLVQIPDQPSRFVNPKYASSQSPVRFADAFPILLISEMSLKDLNSRLADPVPMNRFRPNLVVDGSCAFEEDTWKKVQIGPVAFRVAKPCERCTVPTVNQDTGEAGKEPLRTLSTYRSWNSKVLFGQNLIHEGSGILTVGDVVQGTLR